MKSPTPRQKLTSEYKTLATTVFADTPFIVLSTAFLDAKPHTSTMLFATDERFRFYFATHKGSLKSQHLQKNPFASGALWELGKAYVQVHGTVKPLTSKTKTSWALDELARKAALAEPFWPPIFRDPTQNYIVYEMKPEWLRITDLRGMNIHQSEEDASYLLIGKPYVTQDPTR